MGERREWRLFGWRPGWCWEPRDWRVGICVHPVLGGTVIFIHLPCLVLGLKNFDD